MTCTNDYNIKHIITTVYTRTHIHTYMHQDTIHLESVVPTQMTGWCHHKGNGSILANTTPYTYVQSQQGFEWWHNSEWTALCDHKTDNRGRTPAQQDIACFSDCHSMSPDSPSRHTLGTDTSRQTTLELTRWQTINVGHFKWVLHVHIDCECTHSTHTNKHMPSRYMYNNMNKDTHTHLWSTMNTQRECTHHQKQHEGCTLYVHK